MSVFDIFYLLFKADTRELKKGTKEATGLVDHFNKKIEQSGKLGQALGDKFSDSLREFAGALIAFTGVSKLVESLKSADEYMTDLAMTSRRMNVDVGNLAAWQQAIQHVGGSAEQFTGTLEKMNTDLRMYAATGFSNTAYMLHAFGVNLRDSNGRVKDFMSILPELATRFGQLDNIHANFLGERLGLDRSTIMLLREGKTAVEGLITRQKELTAVTQQEADVAFKFNNKLLDTKAAFRSLFVSVDTAILPALGELFDVMTEGALFFRKHSDLIVGGLIAIGTAIAAYVVPAALSALAAFAPFIAVGVGIAAIGTAFALMYEDISMFHKGERSLLGDMIARWPVLGKIVKGIGEYYSFLWKMVSGLGKYAAALVSTVIDTLLGNFDRLIAVFKSVEKIYEKVKGFTKVALGQLGANAANNPYTGAVSYLKSSGVNPLNTMSPRTSMITNNAGNARHVSVSIGQVTVTTGANNSQDIAQSIGGDLHKQIQMAISGFDDGVAG